MDRYELVISALKSANHSGKLPLSLWKHFPGIDRDPAKLAREEIRFQKSYDSDLMKISPHGRFCVVDFGCEVGDETDPVTGSTMCRKCAIQSIEDWESLEPVDVHDGEFGKQIKAAELIMKEYQSVIPSMMTAFSPFMTAAKLDPYLLQRIEDPEAEKIVREGLAMLSKVILEYTKASLDTGVDGIFLASQHFNNSLKSVDNVKKFEISYIEPIISHLSKKHGYFTVLHLHGKEPQFNLAAEFLEEYLPSGINWHDQLTPPSFNEAKFRGGLLGGLDEQNSLRNDSNDKVADKLTAFLENSRSSGMMDNKIIAPGCVIPVDVPPNVFNAVRDSVREFSFTS
ncbi:MAG: uroporphyrinogen decarboxylase family protein [Candidatus Hodarchaeales archaeon]